MNMSQYEHSFPMRVEYLIMSLRQISGHTVNHHRLLVILCIMLFGAAISVACSPKQVPQEIPVTVTIESTPSLLTPEPSQTAERESVIFYRGQLSDPALGQRILTVLESLAESSDFSLTDLRSQESTVDLPRSRIAVLLSPEAEIVARFSGDSKTTMVIVDPVSPIEDSRAWIIGDLDLAREQAAFLGGYIAALLTQDWRVGVLGLAGDEAQADLPEAFINGGRFFCGLCRPAYPPYFDYPVGFWLTSDDPDRVQVGLEEAQSKGIKILLLEENIAAAMQDMDLSTPFQYLGLKPPSEKLREAWIATLRPAPEQALEAIWEDIVSGAGATTLQVPIQIEDVDPEQLTPGKLLVVEQIRDDLVAGFIQPIGFGN